MNWNLVQGNSCGVRKQYWKGYVDLEWMKEWRTLHKEELHWGDETDKTSSMNVNKNANSLEDFWLEMSQEGNLGDVNIDEQRILGLHEPEA